MLDDLIGYIELHDEEGIRKCFSQGVNPNDYYKGAPLIFELTSEYSRSPRFKACVKAFVDHGLVLDDKALLSVLLDDAVALGDHFAKNPMAIENRYTLRCAYTPLYEATLLHLCAEFNHVACAETLVNHGADANVRAGIDGDGFGGQSPIFHTVNQNSNHSADMLAFLLAKGADLTITVPGLIWGKGIRMGNPDTCSKSDQLCHDGPSSADASKRAGYFQCCNATAHPCLWNKLHASKCSLCLFEVKKSFHQFWMADLGIPTAKEIYHGLTARMIQHKYAHAEEMLYADRLDKPANKLIGGRFEEDCRGNTKVKYPMTYR